MFIQDENKTGGVSATLTLANDFLEGTAIVNFNGKIIYTYRDDSSNAKNIILDYAPVATDSILVSYYTKNENDQRNAIRYMTPRQVKARSTVTTLVSTADATVEKYIRQAEMNIDAICGYHRKYYDYIIEDGMQKLTFPRVEDGYLEGANYPVIPYEITQAALFATENIFLVGDVVASNQFESEKLGDYSYKKKIGDSSIDFAINQIGERAYAMLRGFVKKTGEIDISQEELPVDLLNSRQRFLNNR
jgi:hypothetical protein